MDIENECDLVSDTPEMKEMLMGRIFKLLQGKLKFKAFGRNYFDPTKATERSGI